MIVGFLRHGRTAWNDSGRMQGRADIALSADGRAQVCRWRLPDALVDAVVVTSPLARARETATLIASDEPAVCDALIEMDWGAWEGHTLDALRTAGGAAFEANSARGLDFRAPDGETPREVQQRLLAWLAGEAGKHSALVAVTHQGVIRALLAHASGWSMTGKAPVRLADDVVHLADVDRSGRIVDVTWNVPLVEGPVGRRGPRGRG